MSESVKSQVRGVIYATAPRGVPMLRSKIPMAMTGASDQKTFQKSRYVYSKTLELLSVMQDRRKDGRHALCCAPATVDLEPPEHTDTHNVLVEKVDDPVEQLMSMRRKL